MYHALRKPTQLSPLFNQQDTLVLFGELFDRGYANGLVEEAQKRGAQVISATVGRRDENLNLRPLTQEEIALKNLPLINIPLEAGFDLEILPDGSRPIDQLKGIKLSDWENAKVDFSLLEKARASGRARFKENTQKFFKELDEKIPSKGNIVVAHLMAGGIPRTKIVMPLMNQIVKGTGDRHLSSEKFWKSSIGRFCAESFMEVTAETFSMLIQSSAEFREKRQKNGQKVAYTAYGYHGTEILMNNQYVWQSYAPYLQGWAKLRLENHAHTYSREGVLATVYNCPEILTNSSSIFQGVEICLYALIPAIEKEHGADFPELVALKKKAQTLLKDGVKLSDVTAISERFMTSSLIRSYCDYENFPRHNGKEQMEFMLSCSEEIRALHKDEKFLLTGELSEVVLKSCGKAMLNDCLKPQAPASWINHDYIARDFPVR